MSQTVGHNWFPELRRAANADRIVFGEIFESDAAEIIAEAARLKGVDPPEPETIEYQALVAEIVEIGEQERDELKRLGETL